MCTIVYTYLHATYTRMCYAAAFVCSMYTTLYRTVPYHGGVMCHFLQVTWISADFDIQAGGGPGGRSWNQFPRLWGQHYTPGFQLRLSFIFGIDPNFSCPTLETEKCLTSENQEPGLNAWKQDKSNGVNVSTVRHWYGLDGNQEQGSYISWP